MNEYKKVTEDMRKKLREPLPQGAVKQHPTKTYLSSIKAIYVTERLNDVFGVGSWRTKLEHIKTTETGMVVVKTTFEIPEYGIYYECYGGNDNGGENSKNFDLGDAFKGATTDALTKIGSFLEIGIDVFKGLNTTPAAHGSTAKDADDARPWLSETQFKQLLARIQSGDVEAYNKADKAFKMKKEYRAQLKEHLKQPV
jgi:hypothetical protein